MVDSKYILCLSLIASCTLTGCKLAPNVAQDAPLTPMKFEHWIVDKDAQDKLTNQQTAYLPLYDGFMSIAARLHLINKAQYNLDLQYYIWEDDFIGNLMLSQLLKAADRGVKVRILIDDQNGTALDDKLLALNHHPNFEVRIFNPYKFRHFRLLDYAFRLKHVNHRMHNKLIIADGTVAVTGGRNISSEYFDASDKFQFTDVDIFFAGHASLDANARFQQFWNDDLSYKVSQLLDKKVQETDLSALRALFNQQSNASDKSQDRVRAAQLQVENQLKQHPLHWAKAHFIADSPKKARSNAQNEELIYTQMLKLMGEPKQHLELVSAYFVPTEKGTHYLSQRAQQGLNIRILTNSFLANDVPVVHAFYQKYRAQLLANDIELWEFKPYIERPERTWYEKATGNVIPAKNKNSSSLHAKFFDVDGMVFIGSFNFDPRSAYLNTEVGLVVESKQLQDEISKNLNQYLPKIAYQLKLNKQGQMVWLEYQNNGSVIQHLSDPGTTKFQRFTMNMVSKAPIEWMM